jgi:hypothetical protein
MQYLVHWPAAMQGGGELIPKDENGLPLVDRGITHNETWRAMYVLMLYVLICPIAQFLT